MNVKPKYYYILMAAALYNLLFGAINVLFPELFWQVLGLEPPSYIFLWQCIGMIVGVYGVGYAAAAFDCVRHWPIVLVGFLGKICGITGYLQGIITDQIDPKFGFMILTNDVIWIVPFYLMLKHAYDTHHWKENDQMRRPNQENPL